MWLDPILARLVADDRVPDSCPPQIQVLFLWVLKTLKKFWKQLFFLGSGAWCIRRTENQVIAIIIHDKHCKLNQTFYYLFFEVHFKTINGYHSWMYGRTGARQRVPVDRVWWFSWPVFSQFKTFSWVRVPARERSRQ